VNTRIKILKVWLRFMLPLLKYRIFKGIVFTGTSCINNVVCMLITTMQEVALLWQRDRARHLSVEILQLQNISLENPIVWHYLRDSTFSRFDTIPECDRQTHTDRRTDTRRRHIPHLA